MTISSIQQLLKFIWLQPFTLLLSIVFLFFFYKWLQFRTVSRKNLPPSPPKLPILGNIHQLGTQPHRSLRLMSEKYGDLMMIQLGSVPTLVVSSARAAREIMVTYDIVFANRPMSKKGERLLYNYKDVVGAPYGEYWRQMKSVCVLHLLSNKRVRSFRSVREEETALLIEKIRQAETTPVNLSEMFIEFTNDTICRVAFGRKYDGKGDGIGFNDVMKEFNKVLAEFNVGDFIPWLAWIDRFNGWDAKVDKIAKKFDQFLEKVVREHQDLLNNCRKYEDSNNDEKMKDFVDVLLDVQRDQTPPIDRDSIKALILDMFSAGTDTTSTLLEWTMTELLRHPIVMKETQKEVRDITGEAVDVKEDDLEHMVYLKAVIKETLRLHLPVPLLIPRQSTQETKIYGYTVPARTGVIINGWAIHRDPASWDEPEKFNPQRFLNSPTDFRGHDLQFIPFGAGRRMCPGISFAMASSQLLLANLMHKFDWELPGKAEVDSMDMSESFGINMHRGTPLFAVAIARSAASVN
ncbi:cytochrome P450 736A117 [Beta vulgaris subsp. vulgaris]|uniref:cytochrome P450 736A117 n=1 Tax=Beta vulgaris subsp. vulgaris TaxID=3555 RepID=UPI00053F4630|nr:cytochrome P450 736A117 [Beta vulgaris subsp. vulgaris]